MRYAETDRMGLLHHANYLVYFEQARTELLRDRGKTYKDLEDAGFFLVVAKMEVKYRLPAHYDDLLNIKTILRDLPADHRIVFEHEVFNQEKKLLTLGKVTLYFVKTGSFEKSRMPQSLRSILEPYFQE